MINDAAKYLLTISGATALAAVIYGAAVGDRAGAFLLGFVSLASLIAALATIGSGVIDYPDEPADADTDDDAPSPAVREPEPPARPSPWPSLVAVSAGTIAVGAAVGAPLVVAGALIALVPFAGWLAQVWREHPSWSPELSRRMDDRLVLPVALPLAMFALAAVIAISFSRLLLAISKDASTVIAMVVATLILLVCAFVASRPRLGGGAVAVLAVVAALATGTAGVVGAAAGEREFPHEGEKETPTQDVVARNSQFEPTRLEFPANREVKVEFSNEDEEIFHNVSVYEGEGPQSRPIFNGRPITGGEEVYELRTPRPGSYRFVCDFHANMVGEFVIK